MLFFTERTNIKKYYHPSEGQFIVQEINDAKAYKLMQEILAFADQYPDRKITLYIQSEGGSVTAGVAIYDLLRSLSNPIQTVAVNRVGGIAILLLVIGTKGMRVAYPKTKIVLGQFSTRKKAEVDLGCIKSVKDKVVAILSSVTNMTGEEIEMALKQKKVLIAENAIRIGLIDKITA